MDSVMTAQDVTDARLQLHYAIQLIAAAGAALAEPKPDYSHTSLHWEPDSQWLVGAMIAAAHPFCVALDPVALTVLLRSEPGIVLAEFALPDQTLADGLTWLKSAMAQQGVNADSVELLMYPPDDFPDHAIAHGAPFNSHGAEARQALVNDYALTHSLLHELVTTIDGASPIRVWPHHFDMATLISLPDTPSSPPRSIGVGFSPGDTSYAEPYWYISPYPYPEVAQLPALDGNGVWHTSHWVGAVLTTSQLDASTTKRSQIHTVISSALKACYALLAA